MPAKGKKVSVGNENGKQEVDDASGVNAKVNAKANAKANANANTTVFSVPSDADETLTTDDLLTLIPAQIDHKGIVGHHLRSFNSFIKIGIKQIITDQFKIEVQMPSKLESTEEDRAIKTINVSVVFTNVNVRKPSIDNWRSGNAVALTPNMARIQNLTYSAPLYVNAEVTAEAVYHNGSVKKRSETVSDFLIAHVPVMVGSEICTSHMGSDVRSKEQLKRLQEDPLDPGGYFIVKGKEWAVDNLENLLNNGFHVYRNMYQEEIARGSLISKPGDLYENSYQIIIRYLKTNVITFELSNNIFDGVQIPFYLIFRILNMTRDYDIVNNIVYGVERDDPVTVRMLEILEGAFDGDAGIFEPIKREVDPYAIVKFIGEKIHNNITNVDYDKDEDALKYLMTNTLHRLDMHFLPHIGIDIASRPKKLRFLGHLVNKLLLVNMGVLDSTDRDAYKNKRIHPAGVSLTKSFKTQFNFAVVIESKRQFRKAFDGTQFSQVRLADTFRAAIKSDELKHSLVQVIVTGNKTITIRRNEVPNRVSSQQLYHKNNLNIISQLNVINTANTTSSKQNERADLMRRVQPSYLGYICPSQSADTGEKVGLVKQMACTATVTEASSGYILKDIISIDPNFIPLDDTQPEDFNDKKLFKIFVNGDWMGACADGPKFVHHYRMLRRGATFDGIGIHPYTTIVWSSLGREIYFWTDVGRMVRPLLIVYNNRAEYDNSIKGDKDRGKIKPDKDVGKEFSESQLPFLADMTKYTLIRTSETGERVYRKNEARYEPPVQFQQWIKLNKKHIHALQARTLTIEDLRADGVLEFITADEQENTFIAPSLNDLREHRNDITTQYTHCDVEQAIFGLLAMSSPANNHTNTTRTTYHTNQRKQTCSWFTLNWPYRIDKNVFLQNYCDTPLVKTLSDDLTYPAGQNVIVAFMCVGDNQEDSSIVCKQSIERGMFTGSFFNFKETRLEKGERFGNPEPEKTMGRKSNAVYDYIDENGFIKPGTVVHKGYVLVVKVMRITKPTPDFVYVDKSIVYRENEPAIVELVVHPHDDEGAEICKIKLRSLRPLKVGDKLSSRTGNKSICARIVDEVDMPYDENGLRADIVINPHSIPTRMAIGQIIEGVMGLLAQSNGTILDATGFRKFDLDGMIEQLDAIKTTSKGMRRMFNGRTGNWFDSLIFAVPNTYQRLMKFAIEQGYSVHRAPTNALTHQPLDGQANDGGLKLGEMEAWVYTAQGASRSLFEKMYDHSDGKDIYVCRNCGTRAVVNEAKGIYICKNCGDDADIARVASSWASNLFMSESDAMGVDMELKLTPFTYSVNQS